MNQAKSIIRNINDFLSDKNLTPADIFAAFCAAFCAGSLAGIISSSEKFSSLSFVASPHILLITLTVTVICFAAMLTASALIKSSAAIKLCLLTFAAALSCSLAYSSYNAGINMVFICGLAFVMYLVVSYSFNAGNTRDISKRQMWTVISALAVLSAAAMALFGIIRHNSYMTSAFDFGIFAQMFESMRRTGLPLVTCERNELMLHFGVHFSPFFYLLLPFYCIYPHPQTLLVLQALAIAAAVFPLALICRHFKLSQRLTAVICAVYLLLPPFALPSLYDFHENKFLTVLLLWCVYFMLKCKYPQFALFALLTLSVKEDAAIYIMALALYMMFSQKKTLAGFITLMLSSVYFLFAVKMVSVCGGEVMLSRLDAYIPSGGQGFLSVIKTCISDIGYLIHKVFTPDKLIYILTVFVPLAFLPFMVKKKASLFLLVPMLVINLMPDWIYQYDVAFQYGYGSCALALLLYIIALSESEELKKRKTALFSLSMVIIMFFGSFVPKTKYFLDYSGNPDVKSRALAYNELLSELPKDIEITVNSYFAGHMYNFESVYIFPNYFAESAATKYILIKDDDISDPSSEIALFIKDRYELIKTKADARLYRIK